MQTPPEQVSPLLQVPPAQHGPFSVPHFVQYPEVHCSPLPQLFPSQQAYPSEPQQKPRLSQVGAVPQVATLLHPGTQAAVPFEVARFSHT
jgi:hypothetical protein